MTGGWMGSWEEESKSRVYRSVYAYGIAFNLIGGQLPPKSTRLIKIGQLASTTPLPLLSNSKRI